ncbi:MAG: hypothetical protein V5A43_05085 [Haloarculaceae archaeon]
MVDYTSPVSATFEMQRQSIQQGQKALARSVEFQQDVNQAVVNGLESQRSAQERTVELQKRVMHSALDAMEQNVPGMGDQFADLREAVDEGYDTLLETHEEAFAAVSEQFEEGASTFDEATEDALAAMDEQLEMLVSAHEELETQSVETVEGFAGQIEDLQEQTDELTQQVRQAQEEAIEA